MRELTTNDVKELWTYRQMWLGVVSATDSATPLDVVGWVLANCGSDDLSVATAFFREGIDSGAVDRIFHKVISAGWVTKSELILAHMREHGGKLNLTEVKEQAPSSPLKDFFYQGLLSAHH